MRDYQRGTPLCGRVNRPLDFIFSGTVDGAGGIIQDQNFWIGQKGAGQCQTLALPARKGHTALTEPFLTTHIQAKFGLGWTVNSTVPVYDLEDSTFVADVPADQVLTGLRFLYQQRVRDWLVVHMQLGVVGRLGSDTSSLLADGVTGALDYELGWKMRIFKSESVLVSGSLGLGSSTRLPAARWYR